MNLMASINWDIISAALFCLTFIAVAWFIKGGGRKALSLSAILGGVTVWKVMFGFQTLQALFDALTNLGIYEVPAVYYGYISLGFVLVFLYLWITRGGER